VLRVSDLLVIVGATASGKSTLAVELARRLGGEVVSADAFAVYRGMDIGTAKPDAAMRAGVPHHLVDVADPRERYSAGMFVRDAERAIAEIRKRDRLPVVVGGTHFYVRALLHGLFPEPEKDPSLRRRLEDEWERDPAGVRARLEALDAAAAARIARRDRQRTLRALEVCLLAGKPMTELWREHASGEPRHRFLMLGLRLPNPVLHARITGRVERMFASGLLDEVRGLLAEGISARAHAMKAIGYRECCRVLAGQMSMGEAIEEAEAATRRLAKRQRTWLRAEADVEWLAGAGEDVVEQALSRVEARRGTGTGAGEGRG
jgi:tRNA dimethylallyltransferase